MRICVIGGANADITATTSEEFIPNDSNPGMIRLSSGGVARNIAHNLSLLGHEVVFLTIFAGDTFGWFTADSCRKANIDISLCDTAPIGSRSIFLSINNKDGNMIGGVSDMNAINGMTSEWLEQKLQRAEELGAFDLYVADANLSSEALAFLIDHVNKPLYVDAVSGPKAPKILDALKQSSKKHIHSLKCNQIEGELLEKAKGIDRRFVSLGPEGVEVTVKKQKRHFPALPCNNVNATGAGDALMAGIIHAGPTASVEEAVLKGLQCAKLTCESPDTVNKQLKQLYEELS